MKNSICTLILVLMSIRLVAQVEYSKECLVTSQGDSLYYRLLRPVAENPKQKYPLILFLHGSGERGADNEKQLKHGGQMFLNPVYREKYPAFVVFPQCPTHLFWTYNEHPLPPESVQRSVWKDSTAMVVALRELVGNYLKIPQIDKERVYIIGLSMGGMAVFDMTIRYPDLFTAALPICGEVDPSRIKNEIQGVRFRIFHGDSDSVVPVEGSRNAYRALKQCGVEVSYIEFAGCDHGSWNPAFNYPGFMEWMFDQTKK